MGPYSPAVRAGEWIVLAGQIGIDGHGALVAGGIEAETRQALVNVGAILDDCGVGWADVAKVGIFVTDLGNFATVNALYQDAIGAARPGAQHRRGACATRRRPDRDRVLGPYRALNDTKGVHAWPHERSRRRTRSGAPS